LRWAVMLGIGVPILLAATSLFSKLGGSEDLARTCLRALRYLVAAEFAIAVIAALIGLNYERHARARESGQFHSPGRLVDIGGYRLHIYCTGSGGRTVILEHGHRATYLDWFRVQPELAKLTRVCSYDRAGYGWSDRSPGERVPSIMAQELHTLLSAAGEKPPYVLVAHSFGALNAVMFAHKFQGEVAGLVLVDGSHPDSLRQLRWRGRLWFRMVQVTMPFGLPRWRGWCGGGPEDTAGEKAVHTCRSQYLATIRREDSDFPRAAAEMQQISSLGDVPLVVIARDPALGKNAAAEARSIQEQRQIATLSKNSRFVIADGSRHDVPLARPDVIVNAVKTLLTLPAPADSRGTP
jgi:pimeloyl-ACP methyl ester carboxylesterase